MTTAKTAFNSFAIELDIVSETNSVPQDIRDYCAENNIGLFVVVRENADNLTVVFTSAHRENLVNMINSVYEKTDVQEQEFFASEIESF